MKCTIFLLAHFFILRFVNRNSKRIQREIPPLRHSHHSSEIGGYLESHVCTYCHCPIVLADMIKTWCCSSVTHCRVGASSFTAALLFQFTSFLLLAPPSHSCSATVSQPPSRSSAKSSAKTNRRKVCAFQFGAKTSLITVSVKTLDFRMHNFIPPESKPVPFPPQDRGDR